MIVASESDRVTSNTADHVNRQIRDKARRSVAYYAQHPDEIEARLRELDREWDVERCLMANAAGVTLFSLFQALVMRRKRWLLLAAVVPSFLMQHAVQGYCPPLALFRRMGFRTAREIDEERYALKALRGDFREVADPEAVSTSGTDRLLDAVRA